MIRCCFIKIKLLIFLLVFFCNTTFSQFLYSSNTLTIDEKSELDSVKKYSKLYLDSIQYLIINKSKPEILSYLGTIPFRNISKIYYSDIASNSIPDFVFSNKDLEQLIIENSSINIIPEKIKSLKSLKYLQIYSKEILDISNIVYLENLQELILVHTKIKGVPILLKELKFLKSLWISYDNKNINSWITLISSFSELENITISGINKKIVNTDSLFDKNSKLTNLIILNSTHIGIESLLAKISQSNNIRHLGLKYCNLAEVTKFLNHLDKIQSIDISNNKFNHIPDVFLSNCNIYLITAYNNKIKDVDLKLKCATQNIVLKSQTYRN